MVIVYPGGHSLVEDDMCVRACVCVCVRACVCECIMGLDHAYDSQSYV